MRISNARTLCTFYAPMKTWNDDFDLTFGTSTDNVAWRNKDSVELGSLHSELLPLKKGWVDLVKVIE